MRITFKRILCGTDLSDFSNSAVQFGAALARQFGAQMAVCHVIHVPAAYVQDAAAATSVELVQRMRDATETELDDLAKRIGGGCDILWSEGLPAEKLAQMAVENAFDLVVVATHGRSGVQRLFLGSVTERLMRVLNCPLLIVTPPEKTAKSIGDSGWHPTRILVGCDFSPDSRQALVYGCSLAQEFEAELHLVHVMEPFMYRDVFLPEGLVTDMAEKIQPELLTQLEAEISEETRTWCEVTTSLASGKSHRELRRYAEDQNIDLIVLGVRGRGLMESLLIGSTTDRVIRQAQCPVLSVRAGAEACTSTVE